MNLRKVLILLTISAALPAYGSTFGDNDFPFQCDNLGTSSSSDCDERITKDYEEPDKWKRTTKEVDKEAFTFECQGIKIKEDHPYDYAKSTILRVSQFCRSKLHWLIRRMGSDYALPIFVQCYIPPELTEAERQRIENVRVAFPHSVASLVRLLTNSYVTWYLCGKSPDATLVNLITREMREFNTRRELPWRLFNEEMPVFVKQFMPQLQELTANMLKEEANKLLQNEADDFLKHPSNEAYTWLLFAYEKACIYFMRDFAKALVEHRDQPAAFRTPFQGLEAQTIAQLYMEAKPQFKKKGYDPRKDPTNSTNGVHLHRLELREMMLAGIVPTMGDISWPGCTIYPLEPEDPAPDEPGADDEQLSSAETLKELAADIRALDDLITAELGNKCQESDSAEK